MEATLGFEILAGRANEPVIKEVALASKNVIQTFHCQSPCVMSAHGSEENGINWNDGHIPYSQLPIVLSEAVAIFDHLYAQGPEKCRILSEVLNCPIHDLKDLNCPEPHKLKSHYHCSMVYHSFPHIRCATRNATASFDWLQYHFQTKSYIKCPKDSSRHTALFASGIRQD